MRTFILMLVVGTMFAAHEPSLERARAALERDSQQYVHAALVFIKESSAKIVIPPLPADPKQSEEEKRDAVVDLSRRAKTLLINLGNFVNDDGTALLPKAAKAGMTWWAVANEIDNHVREYEKLLGEDKNK